MIEQLDRLPEYLTAHLRLTLIALLVSGGISLPLGILASRVAWLEHTTLGVASVIQTVPALALLAVMVPLLASLDLQSIGVLPAIVGLTLYGLLPVLRNTVTGLAGVDPAVKEAARGVGMTPAQQLFRVELPLALPVIVAGLRTATVWLVGMATLSTPVGATSLGNYIFSGLQTRNYSAVLVGCVSAAGLALVLDGLVRAVEQGLVARRRARTLVPLGALGALFVYSLATVSGPLARDAPRGIRIGAKTFTEQYILSSLLAQWITRETGHPVSVTQSLGSLVAFDALVAGEIDLYVDYTGTLWTNVMGGAGPADRRDVWREVRTFLRDRHAVRVAATLGFENAYALAMRRADADARRIRRISDLTPHAPRFAFGSDYEFLARPEWAALRDAYGLRFAALRSMDPTLMYQAVALGNVDVISAFSTDGRIAAFELRVLEDDRGAIPPYDAVVLAGPRLAEAYPEVMQALGRLDRAIDADTMRELNLAVDERGEDPAAVARAFLQHFGG